MTKLDLFGEAGLYHEESQAGKWCTLCKNPWPCLTIRLAVENKRLQDRIGKMAAMIRGLDTIARAELPKEEV